MNDLNTKPEQRRILIVDDEKNVRRSVSYLLEDGGYKVATADGAFSALNIVREEVFDLIVLDVRMGSIGGLELFRKLRESNIFSPVLFMSGNASLSEAVDTIRLGGTDFIEKPFQPDSFLIAVARAIRLGELERQIRNFRKDRVHKLDILIGASEAMKEVKNIIERAAPTKSKILIQGETGTGKELIARAIHDLSLVANGPFIKVNCAAIPNDLIESELFGHERGSFTGASQQKKGLFELANKGTIFLDEIGEMSASAQAKVLRALQSGEFTRVGGHNTIKVDVRVLAATHRDLASEVGRGAFREDLFFRLHVVPIRSVPLRERVVDVPILFKRFVEESCEENGLCVKEISYEVFDVLTRYSWPGNVRELKNLAERLTILAGARIELIDIPMQYRMPSQQDDMSECGVSLELFKRNSERKYIIEVLRLHSGNVSQAAKSLGIERTYLHRKICEHDIQKREYF